MNLINDIRKQELMGNGDPVVAAKVRISVALRNGDADGARKAMYDARRFGGSWEEIAWMFDLYEPMPDTARQIAINRRLVGMRRAGGTTDTRDRTTGAPAGAQGRETHPRTEVAPTDGDAGQ